MTGCQSCDEFLIEYLLALQELKAARQQLAYASSLEEWEAARARLARVSTYKEHATQELAAHCQTRAVSRRTSENRSWTRSRINTAKTWRRPSVCGSTLPRNHGLLDRDRPIDIAGFDHQVIQPGVFVHIADPVANSSIIHRHL